MSIRWLYNTQFKFYICLCATVVILTGCASQSDKDKKLTTLVNARAAEITSGLPVQNGGYTLVMARTSSAETLDLLVYSDAKNSTDDDRQFLHRFGSDLCKTTDSLTLLQYGATYRIILRRGNNEENVQLVRSANCLS
jgi:hypothetical protein